MVNERGVEGGSTDTLEAVAFLSARSAARGRLNVGAHCMHAIVAMAEAPIRVRNRIKGITLNF